MLYLKGMRKMKKFRPTKGLSFKHKVKYAAAKAGMIAFTGRFDLHRDEDVLALMDAVSDKCDRLGIEAPTFNEAVKRAKELKKEWDELHAPQRKIVKCKVYMDRRCYERLRLYAAEKEVRGYVENDDLDGLEAMLNRKMEELEELQQRLEDILDGDS